MNNSIFDQLRAGVKSVLGDSIRNVRIVRLGNPLKYAVNARDPIRARMPDDTEIPSMIWVHEEDENKQPTSIYLVQNGGVGKIADTDLIYRNPIYVKQENGSYITSGTAGYNSEEYTFGTVVRPQRSIDITQFDVALLRPTNPVSMACQITEFTAVVGGVAYLVPVLLTTSLTSYISGSARAVRITVNPATKVISYTAGSTFTYNLDRDDPTHQAAFANYPATIPDTEVLIGWVRLYAGMTVITQRDILSAQELISKASALRVRELDGTPSISPVVEIRVDNGSLSDLGGGVISLSTGGGGGGGDMPLFMGSGGIALPFAPANHSGGVNTVTYPNINSANYEEPVSTWTSGTTDQLIVPESGLYEISIRAKTSYAGDFVPTANAVFILLEVYDSANVNQVIFANRLAFVYQPDFGGGGNVHAGYMDYGLVSLTATWYIKLVGTIYNTTNTFTDDFYLSLYIKKVRS